MSGLYRCANPHFVVPPGSPATVWTTPAPSIFGEEMNSQARLERWRGIALFYRKPGRPLARLLHGADLLHEALVPARLERLLRVDVLKVRGGVRGLPGDDV